MPRFGKWLIANYIANNPTLLLNLSDRCLTTTLTRLDMTLGQIPTLPETYHKQLATLVEHRTSCRLNNHELLLQTLKRKLWIGSY
jgi:hypothetical protein